MQLFIFLFLFLGSWATSEVMLLFDPFILLWKRDSVQKALCTYSMWHALPCSPVNKQCVWSSSSVTSCAPSLAFRILGLCHQLRLLPVFQACQQTKAFRDFPDFVFCLSESLSICWHLCIMDIIPEVNCLVIVSSSHFMLGF